MNTDGEFRLLEGNLYHYTSIEGLMGIVSTGSMWATSVHYLNDASETRFGLSLLNREIENALPGTSGQEEEFLNFLRSLLSIELQQTHAVYVLCFSEARNQLSQWRGYAPFGKGICIGIRGSVLMRRMQAQGWTWQPCRYNSEAQHDWIRAILTRMRQDALSAGDSKDTLLHFTDVYNRTRSELLQLFATIKNPHFREEREWRFISPVIGPYDERLRFRVGRQTLIPYVGFQLSDSAVGEQLEICEVVVGPSPVEELTLAAIAGQFRRLGLDRRCMSIDVSHIPYREL